MASGKKTAPKKSASKKPQPLPKANAQPISKAKAKKAEPKKATPKAAAKPAPKAAAKKPAAKAVAKPAPKAAKPAPKKANKKPEPKRPTAGAAYHLAKREDDGLWTVKLTNSTKVIKTFDTKAEAEEFVKAMAERQGRSVLTHNSKGKNKGRIQSK